MSTHDRRQRSIRIITWINSMSALLVVRLSTPNVRLPSVYHSIVIIIKKKNVRFTTQLFDFVKTFISEQCARAMKCDRYDNLIVLLCRHGTVQSRAQRVLLGREFGRGHGPESGAVHEAMSSRRPRQLVGGQLVRTNAVRRTGPAHAWRVSEPWQLYRLCPVPRTLPAGAQSPLAWSKTNGRLDVETNER
jgi:hypothetical protein